MEIMAGSLQSVKNKKKIVFFDLWKRSYTFAIFEKAFNYETD
jgi:hypothetical protein